MAYCGIMRTEKRGRGAVYGLQIEANRQPGDGREFDLSDIAPERTGENIFLRQCDNWQREITREIHAAGVKERKDSVVMLDTLYTASPEFFERKTREEIVQYFRDCLAFHEREFGPAFNAVIHLDEATPHMQVASVPLIEDERGQHLSAKLVMGGRSDYRARQDRFYAEVSREYGLERGEVRDPAETKAHTTKREWQLATQEQRLERAKQQTADERARTADVIDRRQSEIGRANKQKLEALRERDAARADRDVVKALAGLQKRVYKADMVEVDIVATAEEKRSFTGRITPPTVTLTRESYDELQRQASDLRAAKAAAQEITESYRGMQKAAELANQNRIDTNRIALDEAVQFVKSELKGAEIELSLEREAHGRDREELEELREQVKQVKELSHEVEKYRALERDFPDEFRKLRRSREQNLDRGTDR